MLNKETYSSRLSLLYTLTLATLLSASPPLTSSYPLESYTVFNDSNQSTPIRLHHTPHLHLLPQRGPRPFHVHNWGGGI